MNFISANRREDSLRIGIYLLGLIAAKKKAALKADWIKALIPSGFLETMRCKECDERVIAATELLLESEHIEEKFPLIYAEAIDEIEADVIHYLSKTTGAYCAPPK